MKNELFLDTNILVYAADTSSPFHKYSNELVFRSKYKLFTSSKNISEFLTVCTKGEEPFLPVDKA